MDYAAIAALSPRRGHAVDAAAVHEAELRARVRLDADLAVPRASTESAAPRTLPPLRARRPRHHGAKPRSRHRRMAPRLQPARRPALDRAGSRGAGGARPREAAGLVAGVISNSNGSRAVHHGGHGARPRPGLRHRLVRRGRGEARSAHLRARPGPEAGVGAQARRSTSAISTRSTCSGRAPRARRRSSSIPAGSGARGTAASPRGLAAAVALVLGDAGPTPAA